jgi:hypothetical protein
MIIIMTAHDAWQQQQESAGTVLQQCHWQAQALPLVSHAMIHQI